MRLPPVKKQPNSIRRSTVAVTVLVTWPAEGPTWDDLTKDTRNAMDAITDIIEVHLP